MSDTVIREVTQNVWTFSRPFYLFSWVPVGGRSTAVRLSNGGVWVFASTPLTPETKAKLDEIGPVKYILGPNAVHNLFLGDFKKAYPEAKVIGVEAHLAKEHLKDVKFDGAYGKDPSGTKYGFEDEIQTCYFSGFANTDVAFHHKSSSSLIVADLLLNLPCNEQFSKSTSSGRIPLIGNIGPHSWLVKNFLWRKGVDKEAMKRDAKTVAGWDFTRIIPCHGDVIEKDAKKAWETAYEYYLQ